jgi:hypothetical protein
MRRLWTTAGVCTAAGAKSSGMRAPRVIVGNPAVGRHVRSARAGRAEAFRFRARSAGRIRAIRVFVDHRNATTRIVAGLYSNRNGHPGRRLASGSLARPKGGAWNTVIVRSTTITARRAYWIAVLGRGGKLYFRVRGMRCSSDNSTRVGVRSLPFRWGAGAHSASCAISAYGARGAGPPGTAPRKPGAGSAPGTSRPGGPSPGAGTVGATSGKVPCPLTHAAGADGTNSCWATHTGVQAGTGYSEAQIEAGAPGFTKINGNVRITASGTVIDHKWIKGCVAINAGADNVTIKNTLITPDGATCQGYGSGQNTSPSALNAGQDGSSSAPTGTLFQDITVDGGTGEADYGVTLPHGECRRCNVLHFDQGILSDSGTAANPVQLEGDYVHDTMLRQPWETSGTCGHRNGFWLDSSAYVTVDDSYAIMTGDPCVTGAISLQSDWGSPSHITVQNSYGEGVGGMDFTGGCATNTTVTHNAFSNRNGYNGSDFAYYFNDGSSGNNWSGNKVPENGATLAAPGGC